MTCKDCIHDGTCHYFVDDMRDKYRCDNFKNKVDFVEVVRCSECKYQDDCAGQMVHTTRDYVLEQNISSYNKVDYCSYGARK